ncbi:unnamed protein product [Rotaria sordida]|uniref:ADP/ATP translocase n=1 Tax=Rotaria sordida TaxID=392033 RepID=A0A814XK82_9BILA|nr:unnamed protein product [Rotaria sordida]CAF1316245.1 unnamed protein product [Rotaria sordida]CAF1583103.1 unnamed protein product [Rotaria sordida]CAF3785481.1 unnamed protein product [Rotaria sordida]
MKNFVINVLSGAVTGILPFCFIYPHDSIRVRLANDIRSVKRGGGERKYNGLIDAYRKTLAADGIVGLYCGFITPCVCAGVYYGCYFGFYNGLKPILIGTDAGILTSFLLAFGVTITSGIVSNPIATVRRRMMMTSGQAVRYKGSLDCTVQILRHEGIMAFFKGAGVWIIYGIAAAGVLDGFDKLVELYTGIKVNTGAHD